MARLASFTHIRSAGSRRLEVGEKGEKEEQEGQGRTGGNTLDASTTGETANGGLGDALDVVTEDLAVTLRAAFAEALATFSACGGRCVSYLEWLFSWHRVGCMMLYNLGALVKGDEVGWC